MPATKTYDPYDVAGAQRRVCLKRALCRACVDVPKEIEEDENGLWMLANTHGVSPLIWEDIHNRSDELLLSTTCVFDDKNEIKVGRVQSRAKRESSSGLNLEDI